MFGFVLVALGAWHMSGRLRLAELCDQTEARNFKVARNSGLHGRRARAGKPNDYVLQRRGRYTICMTVPAEGRDLPEAWPIDLASVRVPEKFAPSRRPNQVPPAFTERRRSWPPGTLTADQVGAGALYFKTLSDATVGRTTFSSSSASTTGAAGNGRRTRRWRHRPRSSRLGCAFTRYRRGHVAAVRLVAGQRGGGCSAAVAWAGFLTISSPKAANHPQRSAANITGCARYRHDQTASNTSAPRWTT